MISRPSTAAPILAALAIVLPFLYVGGYLWLGERRDYGGAVVRIYRQPWHATIFRPANRLENWLRGETIVLELPPPNT
jgi:hypothetical protein